MSNTDLDACPHCGSPAEHGHVPEQEEGAPVNPFAGGYYGECTNPRCGCCTSIIFHERMEDAQAMVAGRWNRRANGATPLAPPPQFPTSLRKMWSGGEVQEWINEHWR